MRVLTVTNMYPGPGRPSFGAFVQSQVASLAALGHEMEVLFLDGSRGAGAYVRGFGAVGSAIRAFRPDVIHAHYGLTGFVAAFPRRDPPLVLSLCGDDVLGTPRPGGGLTTRSRVGRVLTRLACRRCPAIIVKSAEMAAVVAGWGLQAEVVPNGVDVDFFAPPTAVARATARERLGMADGGIHILFPHTPYEHRKRVDLARAVTASLGPSATLHVVYHQPREVLRDYYRAADVMILTSEWEGSPNVVKEAMACDLPTVSFDVGDVAWLARGTASHRVVARGDTSAMAEQVRTVLAAGVRDGAGKVRRELSAAAVARTISTLYERVTARPGLVA